MVVYIKLHIFIRSSCYNILACTGIIIRGNSCQLPTPTPMYSAVIGRGTYQSYDKVGLERAIAAVKQGEYYRQAAEMYGVPRSTLHDHCVDKSQHDSKYGPKPYLTIGEEEELVRFLDVHCRVGYPYTQKHVLSIVQEIVDSKGIKAQVSNGWWEAFRR